MKVFHTGDIHAQERVDDLVLLEGCRRGDREAWRVLHRQQHGFVHGVARRLGTPPAEVDDVVQEVFLTAFRKLDSFQTGKVSTWLYRITANVVFARGRVRRLRERLWSLFGAAEEPLAPPADRRADSLEAEALVQRALSRLTDKKREVFVLFELDGRSGEEIAELVGCPVQTVWTRLHYARRDFEQAVRDLGGGDGP